MNTYDWLTGAQELDLVLQLELDSKSEFVDGRLESEPGDKLSFGRLELRGHKVPTKVDTLAMETHGQSLTLTPTQRHSAESQVLHCISCRRFGLGHPQWWAFSREAKETSHKIEIFEKEPF